MSTSVQDVTSQVTHMPATSFTPTAEDLSFPISGGEDRYVPQVSSGLPCPAQIRAMRSQIGAASNGSASHSGEAALSGSRGSGWVAHAAFSPSRIPSEPCSAKATDLWYAQTAITSVRVKQEQLTHRALRPRAESG